jgi:1-acyl-sn-glycerol-3-phosphate acyltransferase
VVYWLCKYVVIGPFLRWWLTITVTGAEKFPARGPVIVAANHLAEVDSLLVALVSPRRFWFLAKSEYFTRPGLVGAFFRWFFNATGQIPVDRGSGSEEPLHAAVDALAAGRVLAIYPEGTRSPDGRLYKGRSGVMRIAELAPDALILPVAFRGTELVNPPGTHRLSRGAVEVRFGDPINAGELLSQCGIRGATDRVMDVIAGMSGQERVDSYARKRPA